MQVPIVRTGYSNAILHPHVQVCSCIETEQVREAPVQHILTVTTDDRGRQLAKRRKRDRNHRTSEVWWRQLVRNCARRRPPLSQK